MNMEQNKILAAFLVAGIISMLCWFTAHKLYEPETLKENAYKIEVAGGDAATAAAPAAAAEPIDKLLPTADIAQGEKLSKVCSSCHTFAKGEPNRIGPNLWGVVGGKHAHAPDFAYSEAMQSHAAEVWDYEALNKFLWSPQKTIPGTKMTFAGFKKPEDRAAIIKWLSAQK